MSTDKSDLEPLDPETGVERFLEHRATDCTDATVQNHRYRMKHFLEWCDEEGIDNRNDLSGRDTQRYRLWLADDDNINAPTSKNMLSGFRVFLKWAGSIEAVTENLYSKLMIPRVRRSQQSSDDMLEADAAEERLDYLSKYQYASIDHVILAILWETGMRIGALHSLDVNVAFVDRTDSSDPDRELLYQTVLNVPARASLVRFEVLERRFDFFVARFLVGDSVVLPPQNCES